MSRQRNIIKSTWHSRSLIDRSHFHLSWFTLSQHSLNNMIMLIISMHWRYLQTYLAGKMKRCIALVIGRSQQLLFYLANTRTENNQISAVSWNLVLHSTQALSTLEGMMQYRPWVQEGMMQYRWIRWSAKCQHQFQKNKPQILTVQV